MMKVKNSNEKGKIETSTIPKKKKKRFLFVGIIFSIIFFIWVSFKITQGIIILTNTSLFVDDVGNVVNVVNDYKNGHIDHSYTNILLERQIQSMENQKGIIKPQLKIEEYWDLLDESIEQLRVIQTAIQNESSENEINSLLIQYADKSTEYLNTGLKKVFYKDFKNGSEFELENIDYNN